MNRFLCVLCVLCGETLFALDATLAPGGVVRLAAGDREYRVEPMAFFAGWARAKPSGGYEVTPSGVVSMRLNSGKRPALEGTVSLRSTDDGMAELNYRFTAEEDVTTLSFGCEMKFDATEAEGRVWRAGENHGVFAHRPDGGLHVASGDAVSLAFELGASGETLRIASSGVSHGRPPSPLAIDYIIQDNSKWSPEYHVRLGVIREHRFAKGETISISLTLSLASGSPLVVRTAKPCVIEAGEDWIPLDNRRDIVAGSALDFWPMGFSDAPAGKHGWLRNAGGHFEFEALPGKPQRFYGVNFSHSANFPDHALADVLAVRLRRLGYNAIRIHHHDGGTVDGSTDGLTLNAENMDRLDYLVAAAIREGLYVTTDLYVSRGRAIQWRHIGVDRDGTIDSHLFKLLCAVHEPAFKNWTQYAENFLLHENPYTGQRYVDEPAMPLISLVNEGGFFVGWNHGGRDDPRVIASWREWLTSKRAGNPAFAPDLSPEAPPPNFWEKEVHPAVALWTGELEARMVARMKGHLRSLGCRALITNDNCGPHYAALQLATAEYDYIDDHFYVDHPQFPETAWRLPSTCRNKNPLLGSEHLAPSEQAFTRMLGKPFTITEWNFAGPGRYRGMGGILAGAMSALQDWDGMWRFAYSHTRDGLGDRDIRSPNFFDLAADPLAQAAERASICLFLRGDLAPLTNGVVLWCTPESADPARKTLWGFPPWSDAAWTMRVGSCLAPADAKGVRVMRREEANSTAPGTMPNAHCANGGAVRIDRGRGAFSIVTPRTCGGFAESGRIDAWPLSFTIQPFASVSPSSVLGESKTAPTTLWASSLDGAPLISSSRILLTHLTDVQGEGAKFADDTMTTLLAFGGRPLVRRGSARVELRLAPCGDWRVFALDTAGRRIAEIPATGDSATGNLVFIADTARDVDSATLLYEIVR